MKQSTPNILSLVVLLVLGVPGLTQQNAVVRLEGLPSRAMVYVDGKEVLVEQGKVKVPAGLREIQVEARRPGCWLSGMNPHEVGAASSSCVDAWRVRVQVEPNQTISMPVEMIPVEVVTSGAIMFSEGAPGPRGWSGPAGPRQVEDINVLHGPAATAGKMRFYLSLMLMELYEQARTVQPHATWYTAAPTLYWFAGKKGRPLVAPSGPAGPPGPAGLPSIVRQYRVKEDALLVDKLASDLGVPDLRRRLQAIEQAVGASFSGSSPAQTRSPKRSQIIPIYTPVLHTLLERQEELWGRMPRIIMDTLGPTGRSGPRGPMGPPGPLEANDPVVTLGEVQVTQLSTTLKEDAEIKRWLKLIEGQLRLYEQVVQNLEGIAMK